MPARPGATTRADARPLVALFASGAAGLMYEVCWIRSASRVFGSTVFAAGTVLAVFFLGLALGSQGFGRLSQRVRLPLRLCAAIELALAALALITLPAFGWIDGLYGAAYRTFADSPSLLRLVQVLLVLVLLLPPAILLGGTLPLFARQFVRHAAKITRSIGFLYGLNTAGAAIGCAIAGFVLIPGVGVALTVGIGAAANGVAAWCLFSMPATELEPAAALVERAPRHAGSAPVLAIVFLSGLAALGDEVLWTRFLSLVVRNTVYTYVLTLCVILAGIVVGSFVATTWFDRARSRATLLGALQAGLGLLVLALLFMAPPFWQAIGQSGWAIVALLFVPAVLSGASFPVAARLLVEDPAFAGRGVGQVVAINTAGGIAGALFTGFVLLPRFGLDASTRWLTGVSVAAGALAWLFVGAARRRGARIVTVAACVAAWLAIPAALRTRLPADYLANGGLLVAFREGLLSNLAIIRRDGMLALEIDRWWQGQDRKSHQVMAAHLPMLLHPEPRRVLVVGVGAGQTPARFLMYDVDRLDCVDIEPAIFPLIASHFDSRWMSDPRVRLIREDGRNFVAHTRERYDVVSLEVGQMFRPGIAAFYTEDFYRAARAHLAPGGIVSQFVPMPFLDTASFHRVLHTFLEVFPASTLWYNTSELLLIGVNGEHLTLDSARVARLLGAARIHDDLDYSYWGGDAYRLNHPAVLLGGFLCGARGLRGLSAGAGIDRDDRPVLEYATASVGETRSQELPLLGELRAHLDPVESLFAERAPASWTRASVGVRERNLDDIEAAAELRDVEPFRRAADYEGVLRCAEGALRANPENAEAQRIAGDALVLLGRFDEAVTHASIAVALRPDDGVARRVLAVALHRLGRVAEAIPHYRAALALAGDDAETHNNLGAALGQLGDLTAARDEFERAVRLDPTNGEFQQNLGRVNATLRAAPPPATGR